MSKKIKVILPALIILAVAGVAASFQLQASHQDKKSPYTQQISSPVRGLSAQEVDDLLNGRGAGYARMAELNSYPGPLHVLELKEQLNLPVAQVQQIESVFQSMNAEAKRIGAEIVERERMLSTAFADDNITSVEVQAQTDSLADLYGELRATHLKAHLEITPMLSSEQILAYNTLRGYSDSKGNHGGSHSGTHHGH